MSGLNAESTILRRSPRDRPARSALPPGPGLPSTLQTIGWVNRPMPFMERCRARYGDTFTLDMRHFGRWVFLCDPEDVKKVFTADTATVGVDIANPLLGPILGSRSVMLLDEPDHLRRRKLLLPYFRGRHLQRGQVRRIRQLSAELQRIDAVERAIVQRRDALDREQRKQAEQLLALQQARRQRASLLAGKPEWRTIIDVDALGKAEGATRTAPGGRKRSVATPGPCRTCWRSCAPPRRRRPATPRAHARMPVGSPRQRERSPPGAASSRARRRCGSAAWGGPCPAACWRHSAGACPTEGKAMAC